MMTKTEKIQRTPQHRDSQDRPSTFPADKVVAVGSDVPYATRRRRIHDEADAKAIPT